MVASTHVKFVYPPELLLQPVLYQLGNQFNIVTIRRADLSDSHGRVDMELQGDMHDIQRAVDWACQQGLSRARGHRRCGPRLQLAKFASRRDQAPGHKRRRHRSATADSQISRLTHCQPISRLHTMALLVTAQLLGPLLNWDRQTDLDADAWQPRSPYSICARFALRPIAWAAPALNQH